ncbi:hypothetical protein [Rhizobium sp. ZPR3]|uniref:Uncharacterized protein n=2 Tax=unclassified Rhizobium TaxID=2613769 RepID=A0AAU7SQ78_9HYPH
MSIFVPLIFLAASIPAMPPAPIGEEFPALSGGPAPIIFEFTDYGGTKSALKAKVTPESVQNWCGNWHPSDTSCAQSYGDDGGRVYEASANCETGDLQTDGKHYLFDGPDTKSKNFYGYPGVRDSDTGKRVADTAMDRTLGAMWLQLCPFGWPYRDVPVTQTFRTEDRYGEPIGHNGSLMFNNQKQHIIVYEEPKASIAGAIKPNTVLVHGWEVPNEWFSGVAYTFKKGCDPAPYLVNGHYQSGNLTLLGKAPIREGCNIVGYSNKSPNAKLVFDLSE